MHPQKTIKFLVSTAFFYALFSVYFCKSTEIREDVKNSKTSFNLNDLQKNYAAYQNLQADFIVKGFISGNGFTYNGKISVERGENPEAFKLSMVVRDMVFFSPLISIDINQGQLKWKDHLNNQEKNFPYGNSSIVFFSKQLLPADILIPLLTGNLPGEMLKKTKAVSGNASIQYSNPDYEVVGFFSDSVLNTLICNPKEDFHQIVYKISGKINNKQSRYFPEKIKILLENDDFIEINYSKIDLH